MNSSFIISNGSSKSGKTTSALNLALSFVLMGHKVRLLGYGVGNDLSKIFGGSTYKNHLLTYQEVVDLKNKISEEEITIVDLNFHQLKTEDSQILTGFEIIVPVINEFYGAIDQKAFLAYCKDKEYRIKGILPVMVRAGSWSEKMLEHLKEVFGEWVLDTFIPRNFYLAKQRDYEQFNWVSFSQRAATTYLKLASELIHVKK